MWRRLLKIGENAEGIYEYVIKYKGRLSEVKDYENIIIKSTGGNFLRIKDVAKVELGAFNYGTKNIAMGKEGVVVGFSKLPVQMPKISPPKSCRF
jgi:HAE1 family hydrophobic/amphiphilic exporter-1